MQPDAEDLRALIGDGADIDILMTIGSLDQLHRELAELIDGEREIDLEQPATLQQPLIVLLEPEQIHLPDVIAGGSLLFDLSLPADVRHDYGL